MTRITRNKKFQVYVYSLLKSVTYTEKGPAQGRRGEKKGEEEKEKGGMGKEGRKEGKQSYLVPVSKGYFIVTIGKISPYFGKTLYYDNN